MEQKLFTGNFTLLVLGQVSSLFGNYILRLALSMYVLEKTGSAAVFAGILSLATIPTILLSPWGGILADRMNRRNIMVALDFLTGIFVLWAAVLLSGDNIIRGNAVVNQVASISYLTAPLMGGLLYAAVGLKPVMYASVVCFFLTAALECFIKLACCRSANGHGSVLSVVRNDFVSSIRFIMEEQTDILKLLLLAALSRFFVMGVTLVGLPYIVRSILALDAKYYGAAESALAIATILGSIAAGLLTGKLKFRRLSRVLAAVGVCMIPAGAVFLIPCGTTARFVITVASFGGMQAAISVFSIFAVSMIQQNTPDHMIGKVMAYTSAITMCVQPVGQMVYGLLLDEFRDTVSLVLIFTGLAVCMIGVLSDPFFQKRAKDNSIGL